MPVMPAKNANVKIQLAFQLSERNDAHKISLPKESLFQTLITRFLATEVHRFPVVSLGKTVVSQDIASFNQFGVAAAALTEPTKEPTPWRTDFSEFSESRVSELLG